MSKYADMMATLNSFDGPEAVADFLSSKGIKGEVQDGEACVISNWFLTETEARGCSTTEVKITILDENSLDWEFETSDSVHQFIVLFDHWAYPHLIIENDGEY